MHLFAQSAEDDAPFEFQDECSFLSSYRDTSRIESRLLLSMANKVSPDMILICSWNNLKYLSVARKSKATRILFMDNQWRKTIKQISGVFLRSFIIAPHFDGVLLPGQRQERFARYLGFKPNQISKNGYSADIVKFLTVKTLPTSRAFLFVGRLVEEKGLDILIQAYERYRTARKNPWSLNIVGNGVLKEGIRPREIPGVRVIDFIQPALLPSQFAASSCFILPSSFEPWGLVIHEAAASGLPIISSDACGASDQFVENAVNGFIFKSKNSSELEDAMIKLHDLSVSEWSTMSSSSRMKAKSISPETWAKSLLELVETLQSSKDSN